METLSPNETEHVFVVEEGEFHVCARDHSRVGSNGFYFNENPFHYVLPTTLFQIIVVILISRLLYFILRPVRTPKLVCNALAGIILGPSVLGRSIPFRNLVYPPKQAEFLLIGASVGTIYSLFLISLKMDIATTLKAAKKTWRFGIIPTIFCFMTMMLLLSLYGSHNHDGLRGIYNGAYIFTSALSLSNFAVISDALMELNLITSELGQIALSSAMINDAILWMIMIATNLLKTKAIDSIRFLFVFWGLIFFCIFILRPIMLKLAKGTPIGKPLKEVYIVMILVGVLFMSGISDSIGLSFLQGPFLLGLIMPNGPPLGTTIIERTENIVSQVFMPLFFAYLGLSTDTSKIKDWEMFGELHTVLLAGYIAKMIGCMLVAKTYNIKLKQGLVLGLILNLKGIVELVIILRMKKVKLLNTEAATQVLLFSLVMTAIISPLIEFFYKPHNRLEKPARHRGQTIQNCSKNSEFCVISCIHNEGNVHGTIALLEAFNPNESSPICVYVTHLIELLGKSTPVFIPFEKNKRKSMSADYANTNHIMRAFENYSINSPGPVIILPYVNIAPYKNMHVSICNLIQDKSISFLIIPFHQDNKTPGGGYVPAIRDLNAKLQASAPCTMGILVNKNSHSKMRSSEFCFHVGIFFIGGADDREVLALGSRMSEHEHVKISLFLFLLKNRNLSISQDEMPEDIDERMLDEDLIDEFKGKNIGNSNVVLHEIEVDDGIQVLETIRVLQGNYDLVMVGREHDIGSLKDLEMSEFVDNAEMLGVFGDMLASNEFCNGMVSVLVMQCGGRRDLERTASFVSQKNFGLK